jgi:hypothetical protein
VGCQQPSLCSSAAAQQPCLRAGPCTGGAPLDKAAISRSTSTPIRHSLPNHKPDCCAMAVTMVAWELSVWAACQASQRPAPKPCLSVCLDTVRLQTRQRLSIGILVYPSGWPVVQASALIPVAMWLHRRAAELRAAGARLRAAAELRAAETEAAAQRRHRREVERRLHPRSAADFRILECELAAWRAQAGPDRRSDRQTACNNQFERCTDL